MELWHWVVAGFALWLILSAAIAVLWVAVVRGWRRQRRADRHRRGLC